MRCMLIFGSILFAMYSYLNECRPDVLAWSGVFIVANVIHMIILICRLRPVKFEREIEEVSWLRDARYDLCEFSIYGNNWWEKLCAVIGNCSRRIDVQILQNNSYHASIQNESSSKLNKHGNSENLVAIRIDFSLATSKQHYSVWKAFTTFPFFLILFILSLVRFWNFSFLSFYHLPCHHQDVIKSSM